MTESKNVTKVYDAIVKLTVLEVKELLDKMESELGVTPAVAAAPVAAAAAGGDAAGAAEKSDFDIIMKSFGSNKLAVIKALRAVTDLDLKAAKELVESASSGKAVVKKAVAKEEAEKIKADFEAAGAEIVLE